MWSGEPEDAEQLTWRFRVVDDAADFYDKPGAQLDAPDAWIEAVVATARDLRCLRYGRDVDPDRLMWELSIGRTYAVTIGWHGTAGISGFGLCQGLSMNTSFAEAAVWVADTAQTELAGYDFVQWPSRGRHLLLPRQVDDAAVWIDPHDGRVVSPIGELCSHTSGRKHRVVRPYGLLDTGCSGTGGPDGAGRDTAIAEGSCTTPRNT